MTLEAMYFSKAIIASRSGGIPEVIEHGINGLIFDIEDDKQWQISSRIFTMIDPILIV